MPINRSRAFPIRWSPRRELLVGQRPTDRRVGRLRTVGSAIVAVNVPLVDVNVVEERQRNEALDDSHKLPAD